MRPFRFAVVAVFFLPFIGIRAIAAVDSLSMSPFLCCDGQFTTTTIQGARVWQNLPGSVHFYFNIPSGFTFSQGSPVYVEVTYLDQGYGTLWVQYDSTRGDTLPDFYRRSEAHTRSTRVNGGAFVKSYHQLLEPKFAGRQNGGADFRIAHTSGQDVPLTVKSVVVQNFSFPDERFQYVLTRPWLSGYSGPTRDDVDRSSLDHKVMVGYQGWFRTPNDLDDNGWFHWCREGTMVPENFNIDQWPSLACFRETELYRAGDVTTRSGRPAYVFSSTARETVLRHFRWMRQFDIDGAFLQRFATKGRSGAYGHSEWVLHHVREAANLEGRLWAIEYDVSGLPDAEAFEVFTTDWKWLVDTVRILEDSRYAHEGKKPVVFIWGLPFPDRNISKATADAIVGFFKDDPVYGGNYVIGGLPWWWRTMTDWYDHFRRYDGALAWMPPDLASYRSDFLLLQSWGVDSFPHAWPGFSWANQKRLSGDAEFTPRDGGNFFWKKIYQALESGATRLFIGMFDEYDEGTAIMPMSDDPPAPPPSWGRFITNEGKPADWWMLLAGAAREMLLGYRPYSSVLPTEGELAHRPDVDEEAAVDLGASDENRLLSLKEPGDGGTSAETFAGRDCRSNASPGTDLYFYFDIDPAFAEVVAAGLETTIEIEYHDGEGGIEISLQYDGVSGPYTLHPKTIATQGTGEWRTVRFHIADAYFGNRENGGSDFRVRLVQSASIHLDRIRAMKGIEDRNSNGIPDGCEFGKQIPGDLNQDGLLDLSDAIRLLFHLFLGEPPQLPCEGGTASSPGPGDLELADVNDDRGIDLSDSVGILNFLFLEGSPPIPGAECIPIIGCPDLCQ